MKTTFFILLATTLLLTSCSRTGIPNPRAISPLTGTWIEKDTSIQSTDYHSIYVLTFRGDSFFLHFNDWTSNFIANGWSAGKYALSPDRLNDDRTDNLLLTGVCTDTLYRPVTPILNISHDVLHLRWENRGRNGLHTQT